MFFLNYILKSCMFVLYFFCFVIVIINSYNNYKQLIYLDDETLLKLCDNDCDENNENNENNREENKVSPKLIIPYEEKYLLQVRNMKNEYVFSSEELEKEEEKWKELIEKSENKHLYEITEIKNKINELNNSLKNLYDEEDSDGYKEEDNSKKDVLIIQKIEESIKKELDANKKQLSELQDLKINELELKNQARQFIIDGQLEQFKKKIIIESTPLGNVLLFYNHDKLAFDYYSDSTIPYRFLETVARKYVLIYNYRPLYIDMEEELRESEKKLIEVANQNTMKDNDENFSSDKLKNTVDNKKNVFAKFKSYNKEACAGRVNTVPPPKNNIPQNRMNTNAIVSGTNSSDKILLKENSNRYSHQGKFANFNILQKIDKKIINKKYAMTFADFKKIKH